MTIKTYSFEDGKYQLDRDTRTGLMTDARRAGEPWPAALMDVQHNKMIHAMLNHIDSLEASIPAPMSPSNRFVAYSATGKLRGMGYEWSEAGGGWTVTRKVPAPKGYALVPVRMTPEIEMVLRSDEGCDWEDLLVAAGGITETEHTALANNEPEMLPRETIRAIFIANGFKIKEGQNDLMPYVFEAAEELLAVPRLHAASAETKLLELGREMVRITTTVQNEDEWPAIPSLWLECMRERDEARAKLTAPAADAGWDELRPLVAAVMNADCSTHLRGTTNWAAGIARAVLAAVQRGSGAQPVATGAPSWERLTQERAENLEANREYWIAGPGMAEPIVAAWTCGEFTQNGRWFELIKVSHVMEFQVPNMPCPPQALVQTLPASAIIVAAHNQGAAEVQRTCNNAACGWSGPLSEATHPKHDPSMLLCPDCRETTEAGGAYPAHPQPAYTAGGPDFTPYFNAAQMDAHADATVTLRAGRLDPDALKRIAAVYSHQESYEQTLAFGRELLSAHGISKEPS